MGCLSKKISTTDIFLCMSSTTILVTRIFYGCEELDIGVTFAKRGISQWRV